MPRLAPRARACLETQLPTDFRVVRSSLLHESAVAEKRGRGRPRKKPEELKPKPKPTAADKRWERFKE